MTIMHIHIYINRYQMKEKEKSLLPIGYDDNVYLYGHEDTQKNVVFSAKR